MSEGSDGMLNGSFNLFFTRALNISILFHVCSCHRQISKNKHVSFWSFGMVVVLKKLFQREDHLASKLTCTQRQGVEAFDLFMVSYGHFCFSIL